MPEMIELTLQITTRDEAVAATVVEKLARIALGLSAEPGVQVSKTEAICRATAAGERHENAKNRRVSAVGSA